jgi:hypothetical protein
MDSRGYRWDCANGRTLGHTKSLSTFDSHCIVAHFGDAKDTLYLGNKRRELLRKQRIVLGGLDEVQQLLPDEIFQRIAKSKTLLYALGGCALFNP